MIQNTRRLNTRAIFMKEQVKQTVDVLEENLEKLFKVSLLQHCPYRLCRLCQAS